MCGTQINMRKRKHDSWQRYTFVSVSIRSQRSSSIFIMHILCLCSLWSLIFLTPKFKFILMDNLEVQSKNRFALESNFVCSLYRVIQVLAPIITYILDFKFFDHPVYYMSLY